MLQAAKAKLAGYQKPTFSERMASLDYTDTVLTNTRNIEKMSFTVS